MTTQFPIHTNSYSTLWLPLFWLVTVHHSPDDRCSSWDQVSYHRLIRSWQTGSSMAFWRIAFLRNIRRRLFLKRRFTFGVVTAVSFIGYFVFFADPSQERLETTSSANILHACLCTVEKTIVEEKVEVITPVEHDSRTSVGSLNVHMWSELCGTNVDTIRNWPHFPYFPDKRSFISKFYKTQDPPASNNGERIFGFVHPQTSGQYKFAIASDDTSELWLSPNEDPASSEMIARVYSPDGSAWTEEGDYKKYPDQISKEITLHAAKKYYIESLIKQGSGAAHVAVYWSCGNSTFEIITSKFLSSFAGRNNTKDEFIPPHAGKRTNLLLKKKNNSFYFNRLPVIKRNEYIDFFPSCSYNPSFLVRRKLQRYEGAWKWMANESRVFPQDGTDMIKSSWRPYWTKPNALANKSRVESIVYKFIYSLRSR